MVTHSDHCPHFSLQSLKSVCFGSPFAQPGSDWVRSGIVFHPPESLHAFGLNAKKGPSKAFQLVFQACILKFFLFHKFEKPT